MKKIRVAMMAVALVAGVSSVSVAQDAQQQGQRGGRGGGRGGVGMLLQGITVDSTLQSKIDAVVAKYRAEQQPLQQAMMAARQGGGQVDSATMAKFQDINTKRNAEIRGLLATDADKAKFDENVKNAPTGRRGGGGGR
jgi:hypothetical protein